MSEYIANLIKRNQLAFGNISEYHSVDRQKYLNNIKWAIALNQRLNTLDYQEREKTMEYIKKVLNNDYVDLAGGVIEKPKKR